MGSLWLVNLPQWCDEAGLQYQLYDNKWETRARSSGGYDAIYAIGYHHDASKIGSSDKANEDYCWLNADSRPIGAVRIRRNGVVVIGAAGATNTMGEGGPLSASTGYVPKDNGNKFMFAIEAANNGVGEPWPKVQLDAYFDLCAKLCEELHLASTDCYSHWEYCQPSCPGRKTDPAGPTPDYPELGGMSGATTWSTPAFRNLVAKTMGQIPEEDEVTEADMDRIAQKVYDKLNPVIGARVWSFLVGDIVTGEMNEAADVMRSGAYQAHRANPDNR